MKWGVVKEWSERGLTCLDWARHLDGEREGEPLEFLDKASAVVEAQALSSDRRICVARPMAVSGSARASMMGTREILEVLNRTGGDVDAVVKSTYDPITDQVTLPNGERLVPAAATENLARLEANGVGTTDEIIKLVDEAACRIAEGRG